MSAQAPIDVRVALIIGNSAYANSPLLNPANDAGAMSDVMRRLGFEVIELRDGNKAQMAAAILKMSQTLKGRQGVGMLYYAGHGLQLDWRNYMVPVDANMKTAADVPRQAVELGSVVEMFKAAGNRMNIVVLDACRDNPFGNDTSSAKGLAQLDAPPSTFLAYATAPGNVAEDGDEKSGNGLYTQYLLQELKRPTAKIEDVFKRVRLNVRKQSQGRQIPWESTSLEDDFFFNDGVKYTIKPEDLARMAASSNKASNAAAEKEQLAKLQELDRLAALARANEQKLNKEQKLEQAFRESKKAWDAIRTSNKPEDFYGFLQQFPNAGELTEMAEYRLDQLAKPKIIASVGKGQDASLGYTGERFKVGDRFELQVSDVLTNVAGEKIVLRVTGVDGENVQVNNGNVLVTQLSATAKNGRGTFDPPLGAMPVEFQVGKKLVGRSVQTATDGSKFDVQFETKVVDREAVTVPAGTFQTYKVMRTMHISGGPRTLTLTITLWMDPRFGVPVKSEEIGRRNGQLVRSERRELVAFKADRSS
ncbi:MAG: caspase family protein [Pseudomonadota bacterium]